jgi:hypothetical protein
VTSIVLILEGQDQGLSGVLAKAQAETKAFGAAAQSTGGNLGVLGRVATGASGALGHAAGQIRNLVTGPLGLLGFGGAIFSVTQMLHNSIGKAQDWGAAIEKLQGITHLSATALSGLLAVSDRFGISSERLTAIAAFSEKAIGNLTKGLTDEGQALAGVTEPTDAVVRAQERLRVATLRLHEIEGQRHLKLSTLVGAQNRVADAQRALNVALAAGGTTVDGADKFLKDYGFDIRNADGSIKDFETRLLDFADYWKNGAVDPAIKAAAAAKLFTKSWADLVPMLNLGKSGIQDAADEAAKLGLTLTQDNVVALARMREETRNLKDATGGLTLQIGLGLVPALTDAAHAAATFVADHRSDIVGLFKTGTEFGRQLFRALSALPSAFGGIGNAIGFLVDQWDKLPPDIRSFLTTAAIGERTFKFLFGFSPVEGAIHALQQGIENALGRAVGSGLAQAGLGKLFVQPVFVTNPGFGVGPGPGSLLPAAEGVAGAGLGLTVGAAIAAVGAGLGLAAIMALAAELIIANSDDPTNERGRKATAEARGLDPNRIAPPGGRRSSAPYGSYRPSSSASGGMSPDDRQAAHDLASSMRNADRWWAEMTSAVMANTSALTRAPWLKQLEESWRKAGATMHERIKAAIAGLGGPNTSGAAAFLGSHLGNAGFGAGGYDQAQQVLAALRALHSGDPAVATAIRQLERRLSRLKTDKTDLAEAERIAQSSDPKNKKLDALNALMADVKAHGDRTTQKKLQDVIDAVKHQKLHATVNVGTGVDVGVFVSGTGVSTKKGGTSVVSRYSNVRYEYAAGGAYPAGRPRLVGEEGPELDIPNHSGQVVRHADTAALSRFLGGFLAPSAPARDPEIAALLSQLRGVLERLANRPDAQLLVKAVASSRDIEAAAGRRSAIGPTRARQGAIAPSG